MRTRFPPCSRFVLPLVLMLGACGAPRTRAEVPPVPPEAGVPAQPDLRDPREKSFSELRQLTFGGENAEAYWSFKGDQLIFQSTRPPFGCDQIFRLAVDAPGSQPVLVSTGKGNTTCSYFLPGDAAHHLFLDPSLVAGLPAAARSVAGLRVAARRLRDLFGARRRQRPGPAHAESRATTPRRPSARRTARSSSRRFGTAISSSTGWTRTARTCGV